MLNTYINKFRDFNHELRVLLLSTVLVGFTLFGILFTLFNIYMLRLGFNTQAIGQVNGIGWLTYAIICVPSGMLARRVSLNQVIVVGLALMGASFALLSFSGFFAEHLHYPLILIGAVLSKIGFAFYFPNLASSLLASCTPEQRSHVFSSEWALFALGGFAGSLAGGRLPTILSILFGLSTSNPIAYQLAFLISAFLLAMSAFWVHNLKKFQIDPQGSSAVRTTAAPYQLFILMAGIYALWMIGEQGVGVFFNVFLDTQLSVPVADIGSLLAMVQFITIPLIMLTPLLTTRFGNRNTVFFMLILVSLCLIPIASAKVFISAGALYLILSVAASVARPTYLLYCQTRVVDEWRPVMSGAVSTMSGLGSAFTSAIGGGLIASYGFRAFYYLCAVMIASSALIFGIMFIKPNLVGKKVSITQE